MVGIDKKQNLKGKKTQVLIADGEENELIEQQKKILSLIQEKNELQQMLESITAEKEQLKTDLRENIEMVGFSSIYLRICFSLHMFLIFTILLDSVYAMTISDTSQ